MFTEKPGTEAYLRQQRSHIRVMLAIGGFLFSILLSILFPKIGGLIAIVLLLHIQIAQAVIFRRLECNPKVAGSEQRESQSRSNTSQTP
jgi:hypothetical protein